MNDLKFHFEMHSDGKPVLKNIRRAGDESTIGVARLADMVDSCVSELEARIISAQSIATAKCRPASWKV